MSIIPNDIYLTTFLEDKEDLRMYHLIKENQDLHEKIKFL